MLNLIFYSKNCNQYFYREFIRELSRDLKQKPKQSLSGSGKPKTNNIAQQQTNNNIISLLGKLSQSQSQMTPTNVSPQLERNVVSTDSVESGDSRVRMVSLRDNTFTSSVAESEKQSNNDLRLSRSAERLSTFFNP